MGGLSDQRKRNQLQGLTPVTYCFYKNVALIMG
jgi:hypothetical protein